MEEQEGEEGKWKSDSDGGAHHEGGNLSRAGSPSDESLPTVQPAGRLLEADRSGPAAAVAPSTDRPPRARSRARSQALPGERRVRGRLGLPFLGETVPLLTNTLPYLHRREGRYGPIWKTRFMGQRVAVVTGAEAQRAVLEGAEQFPAAPGYRFVEPLLGHCLLTMDGAEHDAQRHLLTPAFATQRYAAYVRRMDRVLDGIVDAWGDAGERVFHQDALTAMFAVSCSLTLSLDPRDPYAAVRVAPHTQTFSAATEATEASETSPSFEQAPARLADQADERATGTETAGQPQRRGRSRQQLSRTSRTSVAVGGYEAFLARWQTMQRGLLNPFRLPVPGLPWSRAVAARRWIEQFVQQVIWSRRALAAEARPKDDILAILLAAQEAQQQAQAAGEVVAAESLLTDAQIVNHVILLLFAGYETTAGTMSWLLVELLRQPGEVLRRVRAELQAERQEQAKRPVTLEELRATPYLDAVIKETLRLHPAQHVSIRGVSQPWQQAGKEIPAGWGVIITPIYTHRNPQYFADPERFDPNRFLAPRYEDRQTPYALAEFGGGAHSCLGSGLAKLFLRVMTAKLLRRFEALTLAPGQDLRSQFIPTNRPAGGAHIRYRAWQPPPAAGGA